MASRRPAVAVRLLGPALIGFMAGKVALETDDVGRISLGQRSETHPWAEGHAVSHCAEPRLGLELVERTE